MGIEFDTQPNINIFQVLWNVGIIRKPKIIPYTILTGLWATQMFQHFLSPCDEQSK